VERRIGEGPQRRRSTDPMMLRAALAYARRAIPVFPCEPGGKTPLTYSGFWDATQKDPLRARFCVLRHQKAEAGCRVCITGVRLA
jgi:hypothetical protein